jgi:hypothetical protein
LIRFSSGAPAAAARRRVWITFSAWAVDLAPKTGHQRGKPDPLCGERPVDAAAARARRLRVSQFSLFGAAAAEPSLDDLDGVLLAGGRWVRSAGTARLSVVVAHRWRADALAAEFKLRGAGSAGSAGSTGGAGSPDSAGSAGSAGGTGGADPIVPAEDGFSVRTAFVPDLAGYAARWARGANEGAPPDLRLTAGGLRLWALAAGSRDEVGFLFASGRAHPTLHLAAGAQLSRLGLAAVSLTQRPGPGWRITSVKRIHRLAELLGEAPPGGEPYWPLP